MQIYRRLAEETSHDGIYGYSIRIWDSGHGHRYYLRTIIRKSLWDPLICTSISRAVVYVWHEEVLPWPICMFRAVLGHCTTWAYQLLYPQTTFSHNLMLNLFLRIHISYLEYPLSYIPRLPEPIFPHFFHRDRIHFTLGSGSDSVLHDQ